MSGIDRVSSVEHPTFGGIPIGQSLPPSPKISDSLHTLAYLPSFFERLLSWIIDLFSRLFSKKEVKPQALFSTKEIKKMKDVYLTLGKEKWKEALNYGTPNKDFYEKGKGGYIEHIEKRGFPLIHRYLGTRLDSKMFLEIHREVCFGLPKIRGVFRSYWHEVSCTYERNEEISRNALNAFTSSGHGNYQLKGNQCVVKFNHHTTNEITKHVDRAFHRFYENIEQGKDKISCIALLAQRLFWIHPPHDGRTRTIVLIMQKLFTEYLGHPGIFQNIRLLSMRTLEELAKDCEWALDNWELSLEQIKLKGKAERIVR